MIVTVHQLRILWASYRCSNGALLFARCATSDLPRLIRMRLIGDQQSHVRLKQKSPCPITSSSRGLARDRPKFDTKGTLVFSTQRGDEKLLTKRGRSFIDLQSCGLCFQAEERVSLCRTRGTWVENVLQTHHLDIKLLPPCYRSQL
jgi:hypothetical protein